MKKVLLALFLSIIRNLKNKTFLSNCIAKEILEYITGGNNHV